MTRRTIKIAVLTALTAALAACASPTAPASHTCQPGVGSGSGTC